MKELMTHDTRTYLGTKTAEKNYTKLTEEMVDSFPAVDPHVHVPGTISPQTAWELGLRNKLIHMDKDEEGRWIVVDGPNKIGQPKIDPKTGLPVIDDKTGQPMRTDPVQLYSNLFISKGGHTLTFDEAGKPIDLDYNYHCYPGRPDMFSGFDAIQATTQGHRHMPGGIQTPEDYRFVMEQYLQSCVAQNIKYCEPSQNITIAKKVLWPDLPEEEARKKFFQLCREIIAEFEQAGVALRFTHCANKTGDAAVGKPLSQQANDWADWLEDANQEAPGVFVGMTTAGNEKNEIKIGGPRALVEGYQRVSAMGLGVEGHYGEGAGIEHMMKARSLFPDTTRWAHGYQIIELPEAIASFRESGTPLIMSPDININLGGVVHYKDGKPHHKLQRDPATGEMLFDEKTVVDEYTHEERTVRTPKRVEGIVNHYIKKLEDHPIWTLMRDHHLSIGLMSDDPQQGGIDYKTQAKRMAGLTYHFPKDFQPMSAEEFVLCNLNALQVAFCEPELKARLTDQIVDWMNVHHVQVDHPLLNETEPELPLSMAETPAPHISVREHGGVATAPSRDSDTPTK